MHEQTRLDYYHTPHLKLALSSGFLPLRFALGNAGSVTQTPPQNMTEYPTGVPATLMLDNPSSSLLTQVGLFKFWERHNTVLWIKETRRTLHGNPYHA